MQEYRRGIACCALLRRATRCEANQGVTRCTPTEAGCRPQPRLFVVVGEMHNLAAITHKPGTALWAAPGISVLSYQ